MPVYDRKCTKCEHTLIDCFEPVTAPAIACPKCAEPTERVWIGKGASVIDDSIPGGVLIEHGLCNPDSSPRRYYSKSEMAAEAKRRGLVNYVRHVGERGSDKNPHTTRWV